MIRGDNMAIKGKTIKQIADEIGVSKQAVQKRISRDPLYTSIQPYIDTVDGTKYIAVVGENLIKSAFLGNERQPVADNQATTMYTASIPVFDTLSTPNNDRNEDIEDEFKLTMSLVEKQLALLEKQNDVLTKELEIKNDQIESLMQTLQIQTEGVNADRHNELAETLMLSKEKINEYQQRENATLTSRIKYLFTGRI